MINYILDNPTLMDTIEYTVAGTVVLLLATVVYVTNKEL